MHDYGSYLMGERQGVKNEKGISLVITMYQLVGGDAIIVDSARSLESLYPLGKFEGHCLFLISTTEFCGF